MFAYPGESGNLYSQVESGECSITVVVLLPIKDPAGKGILSCSERLLVLSKPKNVSHIRDFSPCNVIQLPSQWRSRSVCSSAAFIPSHVHGWGGACNQPASCWKELRWHRISPTGASAGLISKRETEKHNVMTRAGSRLLSCTVSSVRAVVWGWRGEREEAALWVVLNSSCYLQYHVRFILSLGPELCLNE